MKNFFKLISILLLAACLFSCGSDTEENYGITKLTSSCASGILELEPGDTDNLYFTVKFEESFTVDDIRFVSEDETVITAVYEKTEGSRVYYKLTAIEEGEAGVYVETVDGFVQSDYIVVSVKAEEGDAPDDVPGDKPTINPDDLPDDFENSGPLKPAN